jgi:hypothetical protein
MSTHKEVQYIFKSGLHISQELDDLQKTYIEITEKDSNKDAMIYLKMANFYKEVLFKEYEYTREIMKYKSSI